MKIDQKLKDQLNQTMPWLKYTGNVIHTVKTPYGQTVQVLEFEDLSDEFAQDPEYLAWRSQYEERRQHLRKSLDKNYVDKYMVDYDVDGDGLVFYMGSKGQSNISTEQREHLRENFCGAAFNADNFRKLLAELTILGVVDSNVAIFESQDCPRRIEEAGQEGYPLEVYLEHLVQQIKQDRCEWGTIRSGDDMLAEQDLRMRIAGYEKLSEVLQDILL